MWNASGGRTILFVSHDSAAVRAFCERVIWLKDGAMKMDGAAGEVVHAYLAWMENLPQ
jgi:ABC-type polysaccharide/polyol phosphate transport system ATPase subunit